MKVKTTKINFWAYFWLFTKYNTPGNYPLYRVLLGCMCVLVGVLFLFCSYFLLLHHLLILVIVIHQKWHQALQVPSPSLLLYLQLLIVVKWLMLVMEWQAERGVWLMILILTLSERGVPHTTLDRQGINHRTRVWGTFHSEFVKKLETRGLQLITR